jgi:prepilin-type N-terminal cleavage/methylation domain-containing protein
VRNRALAGFTLIELVIVIAVIGILATTVTPAAGRFLDSIEVRGAVTEIESLFSLARHVAIAHGSQSSLVIDGPNGTLTVVVGADTVRRREVAAAHRVAIAANRTTVTYSPTGIGFGASNLSLIVSRNRVSDTVVVSRLGRVRH